MQIGSSMGVFLFVLFFFLLILPWPFADWFFQGGVSAFFSSFFLSPPWPVADWLFHGRVSVFFVLFWLAFRGQLLTGSFMAVLLFFCLLLFLAFRGRLQTGSFMKGLCFVLSLLFWAFRGQLQTGSFMGVFLSSLLPFLFSLPWSVAVCLFHGSAYVFFGSFSLKPSMVSCWLALAWVCFCFLCPLFF